LAPTTYPREEFSRRGSSLGREGRPPPFDRPRRPTSPWAPAPFQLTSLLRPPGSLPPAIRGPSPSPVQGSITFPRGSRFRPAPDRRQASQEPILGTPPSSAGDLFFEVSPCPAGPNPWALSFPASRATAALSPASPSARPRHRPSASSARHHLPAPSASPRWAPALLSAIAGLDAASPELLSESLPREERPPTGPPRPLGLPPASGPRPRLFVRPSRASTPVFLPFLFLLRLPRLHRTAPRAPLPSLAFPCLPAANVRRTSPAGRTASGPSPVPLALHIAVPHSPSLTAFGTASRPQGFLDVGPFPPPVATIGVGVGPPPGTGEVHTRRGRASPPLTSPRDASVKSGLADLGGQRRWPPAGAE